jgi:hypothetical protein
MVHSLLSFLSIFIFFTANLPILFHFRFAAANLRYCKYTIKIAIFRACRKRKVSALGKVGQTVAMGLQTARFVWKSGGEVLFLQKLILPEGI